MKTKARETEKATATEINIEEADTTKENPGTDIPEAESYAADPNPETSSEDEPEKIIAKAEEYFGQLQRLQADFDNYRKRTQKEKADMIRYASERLVKDLLPVLDNFERAVEAARTNPDMASFTQGVDMIFKQFQDVLGKEGLKAMESVGQTFDPNLHEAVHRVDSQEYGENIIVEELQKGYYLKEKVLRPGMVTVAN